VRCQNGIIELGIAQGTDTLACWVARISDGLLSAHVDHRVCGAYIDRDGQRLWVKIGPRPIGKAS